MIYYPIITISGNSQHLFNKSKTSLGKDKILTSKTFRQRYDNLVTIVTFNSCIDPRAALLYTFACL